MCATALCTLRCYDHYIQMLSRDTGSQGVKQFWSVETWRWGGELHHWFPALFFLKAIFKFVVFFSRLVTLLMLMLDSLRRFLNVFFLDFYKIILYTDSIVPSTCWKTLLQLPISWNFFQQNQPTTTNTPTTTEFNNKTLFLAPLWLCSSHIPQQKKTGVDLQLHWYHFGSQWSSFMPLLYLGTTPDYQTDWRWGGREKGSMVKGGDRWRWVAKHRCFL